MDFLAPILTLPINGTNEIQTVAIGGTPTGGTFYLKYNGLPSSAITWSATTNTLVSRTQTACDSLFGAGNTLVADSTLSSGIGNMTVTFKLGRGSLNMTNAMTATNALTGTAPTVAIARTTKGITASVRGATPGDYATYIGLNRVNEVQTITFGGTISSGTFTITGASAQNPSATLTTAAITWSATNATLLTNIQSACDTTFGSGNTLAYLGTITSGIGTIRISFVGNNSTANMSLYTATSSLVGTLPTVAITNTTAGGAASSATMLPILYENMSLTNYNPTWQPAGNKLLVSLGSPALGTTLTLHTAADTGSDQTFTTFTNQPDVARCLLSTPSGTTANVTAVQDYVEGTDINGNFITEDLPAYTAGAATAVTSVNAFKTVTKYIQRANGASVTITTKYSPKLGLGLFLSVDTVEAGFLAGVREGTRPTGTASSTTLSKNLVQLSSALNATAVKVQVTPS